MTNEAEKAAASKRVMLLLVVVFVALVALWATASIDTIVGSDQEASARLVRS